MEKVLLCKDCIMAIQSRGEDVYVGRLVERWEYEEENKPFICGFCGSDFCDDEAEEDDELYECIW